VNRQILRLEEELGTELFDRVPSGMRLNAAGERLRRMCSGTLHDFHLMRTELDALKGERKGHVSVAAMDSLLIDFLPAAVEEFSEQLPGGALQHPVGHAQRCARPRCPSGDSDIGICYLGKTAKRAGGVAKAPFPPGVVMAPSHPLARKTSDQTSTTAAATPSSRSAASRRSTRWCSRSSRGSGTSWSHRSPATPRPWPSA
jgi:DNA-binding transcriptional LysR family regulator